MANPNATPKDFHTTVTTTISGVNFHGPDNLVGSNTNAGSPADNPIQNSGSPVLQKTVSGVRFANPA